MDTDNAPPVGHRRVPVRPAAGMAAASRPRARSGEFRRHRLPSVIGADSAVTAGHPLAARAAADILAAGGNAIDAGVAGGLCLAVVQSELVSFAGVASILVHIAETGETWEIDGVGPYPRVCTVEYFQERHANQIPVGLARTVVPAAPDAWCAALARWGTMSFAEVASPALEYAARGAPLSAFSAYLIDVNKDRYQWPSTIAMFTDQGRSYEAGERIVQADLHDTMSRMVVAERNARGGRRSGIRAARDEFYLGETARRIVAYHRAEGGPLALEDLAQFEVAVAPALRGSFGHHSVAVCRFWSQGPVLLQMLNLLEGVDLRALGCNSTAYIHRLAETIKLAYVDREVYYGDPRFVEIPTDLLLSKAHAQRRAASIGERAGDELPPPSGREPGIVTPAGGHDDRSDTLDTSYIGVVDAEGNALSSTPSDHHFDSPVVPGVGCVISPRGSQGWLDPAHPSVVAPGKRPRMSAVPAMAFVDDRHVMPIGSPGADFQPQAVLQVLLNVIAFGMSPQEAVEAPRISVWGFPSSFWPHDVVPPRLDLEGRISAETVDGLRGLGHDVKVVAGWDWRAGGVCAIVTDNDGARWAAADPRRDSLAIAR